MKKYILFLIVCILSVHKRIYGFERPVEDFYSDSAFVLLDDVYFLNEQYILTPGLDIKQECTILSKCYQKYTDVDFDSDYVPVYYRIIGEDGYMDYLCGNAHPYASSVSSCMLLISHLTGEDIRLDQPRKEIEEFIRRNSEIEKKVREQYFYIRNHLSEDEYGGIYYNYDYESGCGQLCVMLTEESKASLLETEGISWEKTDVSRTQIYDKLQYLWKEREKLNIADVKTYLYDDALVICGYDSEQEFREKLEMEGIERDYYVLAENYDITNQDTVSEYLENKKQTYYGINESFWNKMQECLEGLKQVYKEYTYENLFTLVYMNCDYNRYTDFNDELEKYISGVPYYKNEKNPFDEDRYGDPEQIALKMVLENYKILYPEKDYQELYEQYGKEINESWESTSLSHS